MGVIFTHILEVNVTPIFVSNRINLLSRPSMGRDRRIGNLHSLASLTKDLRKN